MYGCGVEFRRQIQDSTIDMAVIPVSQRMWESP
jgi:hypothetical protein